MQSGLHIKLSSRLSFNERRQLIERRAYGGTWFTWPNGCVNLMCWWWSCDSYRCRLTYIKVEHPCGKVMTAPESHHETDVTPHAKTDDVSEVLLVTSGGKEIGDVSEQSQTREDLEKALNEAKKSEAHFRKIIDTIPTLAWCNLPDGSNEFVNQRWCDYRGLSPEEVRRVGCKVVIHPEDLPKGLDEWRTLVASGEGGAIEARIRRHEGAYRRFLMRAE